ncbi:MAG TPA: outer membrane beta-barrel protein [Gemmatimonadaceae bacterium]|nr:outer membrane beta-barrel protein [Gemmatimonadaceae bacterium]
MLKTITAAAALAALVAAAPAHAQGLSPVNERQPLFTLTPYAGYMVYGDFLKGPVGTTLSTKNGPVYGAQAAMYLAPNVAILGNVAYSSSDLQVGLPFLGGVGVGSTKVWLYDGDLQFDIPVQSMGRTVVKPFVQVGAGAMRYDVSAASVLNTKATNFAWNAGAGLDVRMSPTIGLRLMAKDYIGKFDFKEATSLDVQGRTTQNWALTAGLKIGF